MSISQSPHTALYPSTYDHVARRPSRRDGSRNERSSDGEEDGSIPDVLVVRDQQDQPSGDAKGRGDQAHQASLVELHRHVGELTRCTMVNDRALV